MSLRNRLNRLTRQRGPQAGGVLADLGNGFFKWQGKTVAAGELPPGGYLLVPGELPPEQWGPESTRVHEWQKDLIMEPAK